MKNDIDFMRIFDGNKLIGVLNFNNMIPVHESLISILDVKVKNKDSADERAYKILCAKELDWVQKNQDAIIKRAKKRYNMVKSDKANHSLKKRCVDFEKLEVLLEKRLNKVV